MSEVALRDAGDGAGDFGGGAQEIVDQRVDGEFHVSPGAAGLMKSCALPGAAFFADYLTDALHFIGDLLVGDNDFIKGIGQLSRETGPGAGQTDGKISVAHGLQARQ